MKNFLELPLGCVETAHGQASFITQLWGELALGPHTGLGDPAPLPHSFGFVHTGMQWPGFEIVVGSVFVRRHELIMIVVPPLTAYYIDNW